MFSADQSCWFVRKVICWRAVASMAWSVLLLLPTTALFVVLSRFSLFHPIHWISECLSLLTSASTIFSFILLCGVVLLVGFFNLEYYTVVPSIACSKIDLLGQVLHPRQFVHSLAHCIMGVVVAWCCAFTIGGRYRALGHPCTQDESSGPEMCLNEYHLVLLLVGAFIGYSHSLLGVVHNINYVSFHTMRQYKYLRFKGTLPLVVKASAVQALYSLRNFLLLYFFLGYAPRAWICKTLDLNINSSIHSLDSVSSLLDLSLLYHLWISGTFLLLTWYTTVLLFRIFVTEVYSFPVQSTFTEDAHQCLPKVITGMQPMILKFLSLQDLALLSQHSPSRRLEVFSLSQPGGHPHIWTALSKECLSLLSDLTERLVVYHDAVATNGRAKSQSTGSNKRSAATSSESSVSSVDMEDMKTPRPSALIRTPGSVFLRSSVGAGLGGLRTPLTAPFTPDLDSPFSSPALRRLAGPLERLAGPLEPLGPLSPGFNSIQSPHVMRRGPKLWSASTDSQLNSSPTPSPGPAPTQADLKPSFLVAFLQNRKDQVKHFLAKRVLIMYLFNKLPEASSQALFADSQAHIWALEGLSHLVAASYSEDQYGIVQTTLPTILSTMLVLQEAVDRHFKLPHTSSKPGHSSCSMGDGSYKTLRFALRSTLKTAVYRITATFGEHLHAVQMSAEHRKKLQHFLEYKE
ncbi:nucleoporin NDC1 isoform X2 [Coregonus clupeaformis]|uniref:nucleoporin NDC1 isoform X2 n=1 Tax=Coregonus clupeaformis TaxID=59861 RepID=UPI001E1C4D86|nr:nucleoporin NDC1 isoform X2 [Coregonus clupeaformis]